jgi:enoyl-CoA hydratase
MARGDLPGREAKRVPAKRVRMNRASARNCRSEGSSLRGGQRTGFRYSARTLVRIESEGPVTTVTLDRKAVKNAVDRTTAEALAAAFRAFDADSGARVAVLYGDHGTFCAGADLKALAAGSGGKALAAGSGGNRVAPDGDGPMGPTRMVLGKPVIAAIAGHAVAGGLELALWCDLRVAEDDAVLGVFCRRFGVPLIDGGTIRLPRLIGLSRALDLILTGRPVHADEALAIGLVNRVVARGAALPAAQQLAHQLAALPQAALRADRMSAYTQFDLAFDAALLNELEHGRHALAEGLEGAQRFSAGAGRHGEAT